jgi:uncharacterized oligopeptide transporter (OPT) family protein
VNSRVKVPSPQLRYPMTDLPHTTAVTGPMPQLAAEARHPSTFAPATFTFLIVLCLFGALIGVQLILQLGITPNTSIIGALVAMLLARVPLGVFARYRSIHVQNLAQSAISAATFGAANSLLLPIGVPFLLGRSDLILPMLVGAALSMLLDGYMLYRMFDTRIFPAAGTWPPGVAAAEAIRAGDAGGRRAALLGVGLLIGIAGSWLKIPMSAFGVAFIGNVWALTMFGIGLLIRGYAMPVAGIDIAKLYVPHGAMVGAGLVALVQVARLCHGNANERALRAKLAKRHAAATAPCHCAVASDRKIRSVDREMRWRCRLKVLWTAACMLRKRWADRADLKRCCLRSRRRTA